MNTRLRAAGFAQLLILVVLAFAPGIVSAQSSAAVSKPSSSVGARSKARATQMIVDEKIPDDPAIEKLLAPYAGKVRALNVVMGTLVGELKKVGMGGGSLGNFVTDGIRSQASAKLGTPVVIAVTNSGGLRKNTIAEGELRASDIFELLPFENALVEVDLTGEQLLKLLSVVFEARDAQSGARIRYRMNGDKPEVVSIKLVDAQGRERDIDPKATYTVVTIDYLLNVAGGKYSVLQQGKNVKPLGITLRDAIMNYVKAETAAGRPVRGQLDDRFSIVNTDAPKPGGALQ